LSGCAAGSTVLGGEGTFLHDTSGQTINVQLWLVNEAADEDGWIFWVAGLSEVVA